MAVLRWAGGSTARSQVDSLTPGGTIEAGDIFNVILTDESGATQTEAVVATSTTVASVCDDIVLHCSASTQSLFRRLTFTDATTSVTVTAKTSGVPFYLTETTTETGGGTADDQTFARASVTTNKGPNDFNDVDNWVESDGTAPSAVPASGDEVIFSEGSHDLLYGLDQNAKDLEQLRITGGYSGSIGQPSHALHISVSNEGSSTLPILALGGRGRRYNLEGAFDEVIITRNSGTVDIKGTTMGSFTIVGPHAKGIITIKNGSTFSSGNQSIRQLMVDGVTTYIESGVTGIKPVRVDGGYMETKSAFGNANADIFDLVRGTVCFKGSSTVKTVNVNGGLMKWESDQNVGASTNTPLTIYNGEVDVKRNTRVGTLTVYKPTVFNGVLDISSEQSNVALSSPDSQQATVYYGVVKYPTVAGQTSGTAKNNNRTIT
mgnify:FL=1